MEYILINYESTNKNINQEKPKEKNIISNNEKEGERIR